MKKSREQRKKLKAKAAKRFQQELRISEIVMAYIREHLDGFQNEIDLAMILGRPLCPPDCKGHK